MISAPLRRQENRALSLDEIAAVSFDRGWLRPPSAAIAPSTVINNAIRAHIKRCESSTPPRQPLLNKHQLAGSVNESILEPALHPNAFDGPIRPKGTVWFLIPAGKAKWKNPFDGLDVPKPPRKSTKAKGWKDNKGKDDKKSKGKTKTSGPLKIRLLLGGASRMPIEEEDVSDVASRSQGSRSRSGSMSSGMESATPGKIAQTVLPPSTGRLSRLPANMLDSSSGSDTSDSDMDIESGPSRIRRPHQSLRRVPPPPLALTNSSRHLPQRIASAPFSDFFLSNASPTLSSIPPYIHHPQFQSSPFPSHSLDNTTWGVRHDQDRFASLESSSSSDEDMREPHWAKASKVLIRGEDGDERNLWTAEDEETKVKEATEALRVLFPITLPTNEVFMAPSLELNQLDNRPTPSDTSSLAESSSTATAQAISKGQLRAYDYGTSVALSAWTASSSPLPSPNLRASDDIVPDVSPTLHLSKLSTSLDVAEMRGDDDHQWLDESGELPVKAEDTLSDLDIASVIEDAATPEHDRQMHTAAWAREAAANTSFRVKEEPQDYPSPMTTEPDEQNPVISRGSRASSAHSTGSSELTPFEADSENQLRLKGAELFAGPESISLDELDGWLPVEQGKTERTLQRNKHCRSKYHSQRGSGNWGGIGVGAPFATDGRPLYLNKTPPMTQTRSVRSNTRRGRSPPHPRRLPTPSPTDEPDVESRAIETDDAIGTSDLEQARLEAEAREEMHRQVSREKAEQQKAQVEACRQQIRESHEAAPPDALVASGIWDQASPWSEPASASWGSSDSVNVATPSAMSPMLLLHGVSNLSLGSDAMDPKALLSPPVGSLSLNSMSFLDGFMSPAEVEAVMNTLETPFPSSSSNGDSSNAVPITTSPAPMTDFRLNEVSADIVDLPEPLPEDVTCLEPPKTSLPPASAKTQGAFTKRLCPGVDACVVDNIPVYALVHESTSNKVVVLRRLDTDFGESS